jgi:hypothetical protein
MAPSKTPRTASTAKRMMTTRSTNAEHPAFKVGAAAPTRTRRTKAQIEADNAAKAVKAAEAVQARKDKILKVADLEEAMAQEDGTDITPRLTRPRPRRLRRTETIIEPQTDEEDDQRMDIDRTSEVDFTQHRDLSDDGGDTEIEDSPLPKKVKVSLRDAVDEARKASGEMKEKGGEKEAISAGHHNRKQRGDGRDKVITESDASDDHDRVQDVNVFVLSLLVVSCLTFRRCTVTRRKSSAPSHADLIKGPGLVNAIKPASKPFSVSSLTQSSVTTSTRSSHSRTSATNKEKPTEPATIRRGGIPDDEELVGPEREFAINSPSKGKGKNRVTTTVCLKTLTISNPFHF